jgi:cellulose synthase/poly-beta-1,6-N-acetylglucosamine synthase-like glycosyltransferase
LDQFFAMSVIGIFTQALGPVAQYHQNSKFYSAVKPAANPAVDNHLPHITIQMPVYKESLKETMYVFPHYPSPCSSNASHSAPSCESIKKAMQTYARQGGTSTIMICDDGMQLLDPALAAERRTYYADHSIGWIARPGHSNKPDGFKRAGRFKKASNMNYALKISLKLEKHLARFQSDESALSQARAASQLNRALKLQQQAQDALEGNANDPNANSDMMGWSNALAAAAVEEEDGEEAIEDLALKAACEEIYKESGDRFRPWAQHGRALRVGEIILIVDSDTIVPEDCLRDAAREMAESPEVGVIQHESDVMQVAHNYFENGIAHFTRRINHAISFACANGEVAAFVGHNAFLRWSAIQDVSFIDPADGERKIWSESNVSEDFDMALRLLLGGYIVRWASYSEGGFKEGVSLTADDELNRWVRSIHSDLFVY